RRSRYQYRGAACYVVKAYITRSQGAIKQLGVVFKLYGIVAVGTTGYGITQYGFVIFLNFYISCKPIVTTSIVNSYMNVMDTRTCYFIGCLVISRSRL